MTKVYMAGKIRKNDWRHSIADPGDPSPLTCTTLDDVEYVGPYFVSCDHGCSHGNDGHGRLGGCSVDEHRFHIAQDCLRQIESADVVFAWLDEPEPEATHCSAYGTLYEIGFARGIGKPVIAAATRAPYDPHDTVQLVDRHPVDDLWFAWSLATQRVIAHTPVSALKRLTAQQHWAYYR